MALKEISWEDVSQGDLVCGSGVEFLVLDVIEGGLYLHGVGRASDRRLLEMLGCRPMRREPLDAAVRSFCDTAEDFSGTQLTLPSWAWPHVRSMKESLGG